MRAAFAAAGLIAVAVIVGAYSNHFDNGFHFDDEHVIVRNLAIRSLHDWPRFFTDPSTFTSRPENATYRPLLTLSYAVDHALGEGLAPRSFRRTQLGLLLVCWLLLLPLYHSLAARAELGRPWIPALCAATLFCVHTANTQTVNYLSSRSSLLSTVGLVGGLVFWSRAPRLRRYGLYLLPVLLGALAKPLAVLFAPLLTGWVALVEGRPRRILETLPAWIVCVAAFLGIRAMDAETLNYSNVETRHYAMTQPFAWLHYFRLFFWPRGLTADPDWPFVVSPADPRFAAGVAFVALWAAVALFLVGARRGSGFAFGWIWFGLTLLPTSSVIPLSEAYNEHRLFLPFVGLCIAVVLAVFRLLPGGPGLPAAVTAVAVLACAVGTHARNRVWRNDLTLWSDVAHKSPRNGRGRMNHALALLARGRTDEALAELGHANALAPDYEILQVNLAIANAQAGRHDRAERFFEHAIRLRPEYGQAHFFFGRWLLDRGRGPEAVPHLRAAVKLTPNDREARALLASVYAATGRKAELTELARATTAIDPGDPVARSFLAGSPPQPVREDATGEARFLASRARLEAGMWLDGAVLGRYGLAQNPDSGPGWNNLGWALAQLGFFREAEAAFRRALRVDPDLEVARTNLTRVEENPEEFRRLRSDRRPSNGR